MWLQAIQAHKHHHKDSTHFLKIKFLYAYIRSVKLQNSDFVTIRIFSSSGVISAMVLLCGIVKMSMHLSKSISAKAKWHIFQQRKRILQLEGMWLQISNSLKKTGWGSRVRMTPDQWFSIPDPQLPSLWGGGGRGTPVPCPKNSYTPITFDNLFGFGISYEILSQKGFYKKTKNMANPSPFTSDMAHFCKCSHFIKQKTQAGKGKGLLPSEPKSKVANGRTGIWSPYSLTTILPNSRCRRPSPHCGPGRSALLARMLVLAKNLPWGWWWFISCVYLAWLWCLV